MQEPATRARIRAVLNVVGTVAMRDKGLEILQHLFDYLDGATSLQALKSWSSGLAADSHQWGDPESDRLATELLVLFSEAKIEGWTEPEIRDEITAICFPDFKTLAISSPRRVC